MSHESHVSGEGWHSSGAHSSGTHSSGATHSAHASHSSSALSHTSHASGLSGVGSSLPTHTNSGVAIDPSVPEIPEVSPGITIPPGSGLPSGSGADGALPDGVIDIRVPLTPPDSPLMNGG